ncbi:hypothetical protein D3C72_1010080 [compost metagenome]
MGFASLCGQNPFFILSRCTDVCLFGNKLIMFAIMIRKYLNRFLYSFIIIIAGSHVSFAATVGSSDYLNEDVFSIPDSTGRQQKKPDPKSNNGKKGDIKEVPKSRKQAKPAVVKQQPIKIKPVKIAKPKVKVNMRRF